MGKTERPDQETIALAKEGSRKRAAGLKVTQREARALKAYLAWQEEEARWRHFNAVTKSEWKEWSGVPYKTLRAFRRIGFPWPLEKHGKLSVPEFLAWVFPFLAAHSRKFDSAEGHDGRLPAIERKREADAKRSEFELERLKELWLPRELIHQGSIRIVGVLRRAGEALQRQYGEGARLILDKALDNAQREIDLLYSDDDGRGDPT